MAGVMDFIRGGILDVAGFTPTRNYVSYTGWGNEYIPSGPVGMTKSSVGSYPFGSWGSAKGIGWSGLKVGAGPLLSTVLGFSEGGAWGAAKWLGAELVASSFAAAAAAGTVPGTSGSVALGSTVGMIMGGPWGYGAGAFVGALGMTPLVLSTMTMGAVVTAAVGTYYAGKGAYKILEKGYNYRQKMMTSIDTAGSTAAFMTRNAFTMRASAFEAIRATHMNARSALGSEAGRIHFSANRKWSSPRFY